MKVKLVVVSGKTNKREIALKLPSIVGRSRDVGVTVAHPMISRRHCKVFEHDGLLMIRDLGSLNGTFAHGGRVNRAALCPDDEFRVGPITFRVDYEYQGDLDSIPEPEFVDPAVPPAVSPQAQAEDEDEPDFLFIDADEDDSVEEIPEFSLAVESESPPDWEPVEHSTMADVEEIEEDEEDEEEEPEPTPPPSLEKPTAQESPPKPQAAKPKAIASDFADFDSTELDVADLDITRSKHSGAEKPRPEPAKAPRVAPGKNPKPAAKRKQQPSAPATKSKAASATPKKAPKPAAKASKSQPARSKWSKSKKQGAAADSPPGVDTGERTAPAPQASDDDLKRFLEGLS